MRYFELREDAAPETPWHELRMGQPAMFYAYRGVGGDPTYAVLAPRWQARFGRKYLLGDGIYVTPSRIIATRYGLPKLVKVVVHNPYVIEKAYGAWDLVNLPVNDIQKTHDAIIIKDGRSSKEDLKQAVIFPEYTNRVEIDVPKPQFTTLQKGARVRITAVHPQQLQFHPELADAVGKVGTVGSIAIGGHPAVRLKGKTYQFSKQDVEII